MVINNESRPHTPVPYNISETSICRMINKNIYIISLQFNPYIY